MIKINHNNTFNKNGTLLHKDLNTINSFKNNLKKNKNTPIPPNIKEKLHQNNLPSDTYESLSHSLKKLNKITFFKLKLENKLNTQNKIKKSIQKISII